jgi:hypothetical protein
LFLHRLKREGIVTIITTFATRLLMHQQDQYSPLSASFPLEAVNCTNSHPCSSAGEPIPPPVSFLVTAALAIATGLLGVVAIFGITLVFTTDRSTLPGDGRLSDIAQGRTPEQSLSGRTTWE